MNINNIARIKRFITICVSVYMILCLTACTPKPSEKFVQEQYLDLIKVRIKDKHKLNNWNPFASNQPQLVLEKTLANLKFNFFKIVDSQTLEMNSVHIYKCRVMGNAQIDDVKQDFDEWIAFEQTEKGWIIQSRWTIPFIR